MKKVLITGVSGGIGKELCHLFIEKGYTVIGVDLNQAGLSTLQEKYMEDFISYTVDLSDRDKLKQCFSNITYEQGMPEIVINNAGIAHIQRFLQEAEAEFDKVMQINFNSIVDSCRFWLPLFEQERKGTIVNIASVAGHVPTAGMPSYTASKFAVTGLTQSLQLELKSQKSPVHMVLVSPGFVNTGIMKIGQEQGFPKEFASLVANPKSCAKEIVSGILKGADNIYPTLNGKVMVTLRRYFPSSLNFMNVKLSKRIFK